MTERIINEGHVKRGGYKPKPDIEKPNVIPPSQTSKDEEKIRGATVILFSRDRRLRGM